MLLIHIKMLIKNSQIIKTLWFRHTLVDIALKNTQKILNLLECYSLLIIFFSDILTPIAI